MKINHPFPILGVVYLPPTLGFSGCLGLAQTLEIVLKDVEIYLQGGCTGVLLENENDSPHDLYARPETIAFMTALCAEVRQRFPEDFLGVEFLLNDPKASLAIAKASNFNFIRTDYFSDRMTREPFGEMKIGPEELIRYRSKIDAEEISILADIQVKYASMIEEKSLFESAASAFEFKADGVIVSGTETGKPPSVKELAPLKDFKERGLWVGSGLSSENLADLYPHLSGAIVGTSLMTGGRPDERKIHKFVQVLEELIK